MRMTLGGSVLLKHQENALFDPYFAVVRTKDIIHSGYHRLVSTAPSWT